MTGANLPRELKYSARHINQRALKISTRPARHINTRALKISTQQISSGIAIILVLLGLLSVRAIAQGIDTLAPVIELEELVDGIADNSQVFTVQIAEDEILKDATLYYRRQGQLPFTAAEMKPLGNTGFYVASIATDPADLRSLEYYVQARDAAGNRTVSGFAFDPYVRTLRPSPALGPIDSPDPAPVLAPPEQQTSDIPLLRQRWVQITLGVLAVGAIASLSSGGDGDSQVVPLTFNLQ
jgi:hypothetical protein